MKNGVIKTALAAAVLVGAVMSARAQTLPADAGNWVVETNLNQKNYSVVRFYDQQGALLYEEKLQGVYLDVSKPKIRKILNRSLASFRSNTLIAGRYFRSKLPPNKLAHR
ncbi:hypothetical protein [Pontibacter beigongshangensis]|uniref:hypothetical protein n=1 Tax=Pontibacter beigongshangensis TaxID=2574733 RepID=UPI00165002E6|nr:hypothetical protein [Pontibacter beigongshangensis]